MNFLVNAAFGHLRMWRLLHFSLLKCGVYWRAAFKRWNTVFEKYSCFSPTAPTPPPVPLSRGGHDETGFRIRFAGTNSDSDSQEDSFNFKVLLTFPNLMLNMDSVWENQHHFTCLNGTFKVFWSQFDQSGAAIKTIALTNYWRPFLDFLDWN